jgi:aldehyde dehydrogenase (NAD+)
MEMTARSLSAALAVGCSLWWSRRRNSIRLRTGIFADAALACGLPARRAEPFLRSRQGGRSGAGVPSLMSIRSSLPGPWQQASAIATAAARNVVPCVLELGGKSAAIVYDDADLDAFPFDDVRWGIYFNAGQVCSAMSRVIVHEAIHDRLVDGMVAMAEGPEGRSRVSSFRTSAPTWDR